MAKLASRQRQRAARPPTSPWLPQCSSPLSTKYSGFLLTAIYPCVPEQPPGMGPALPGWAQVGAGDLELGGAGRWLRADQGFFPELQQLSEVGGLKTWSSTFWGLKKKITVR